MIIQKWQAVQLLYKPAVFLFVCRTNRNTASSNINESFTASLLNSHHFVPLPLDFGNGFLAALKIVAVERADAY